MATSKKKVGSVLWAKQYSKRLIAALLIMWAIGAVIGVIYEFIRLYAFPETASMDSFYIYLAVPLSCGIPSYVVPNIFLNREKVKQNYIPDYDAQMFGQDGIGEGFSGLPSYGRNTPTLTEVHYNDC